MACNGKRPTALSKKTGLCRIMWNVVLTVNIEDDVPCLFSSGTLRNMMMNSNSRRRNQSVMHFNVTILFFILLLNQ